MISAQEQSIIDQAISICEKAFVRQSLPFELPELVYSYLRLKYGMAERESFGVLFLDTANRLISDQIISIGTINSASVYPREVAKAALLTNAASVIFYHNHPSGITEPSVADREITKKLSNALNLFDVSVLDHIIVSGASSYSFCMHGLI